MAALLTVRSRVSSTCSTHREESSERDYCPPALTIRSRLSASTLPRSVTAPESFLVAKSASKQRCQLVTATSRQLDSVLGSAIATREVHVIISHTPMMIKLFKAGVYLILSGLSWSPALQEEHRHQVIKKSHCSMIAPSPETG